MNPKPTILSIGDTVCDAFIELIDAHINCKINNESCEICMRFADKVPYANDYILYGVGNSANAAVSCSRLGLQSGLVTHLGDDDNGKKAHDTLVADGVQNEGIIFEAGVKTNYHYVLWYRPERTILVKHEHYHYDWNSEIARVGQKPQWIYLSSVGAGTEQYHDDIGAWLLANPGVELAFQPGTYQMKLAPEHTNTIYKRSELFFCNVEEAERILGSQPLADAAMKTEHVKELLTRLRELGPQVAVITDGPNGAYTYDGTTYRFSTMYPDIAPPLERTGAGDAYASTFTAYYAQGLPIEDCMLRAPINSMSVVQFVGAQAGLLTEDKLLDYLAKAPAEYQVSVI